MPKFRDLSSKYLKTNNRFEISTIKIGYLQNFDNIRELILFGPNLSTWDQSFWKQRQIWNQRLLITGYRQHFIKMKSWYFLAQNTHIGTIGLKNWKMKARRKFQIFPILKFWIALGHFRIFLGHLHLVLSCFNLFCWFRVILTFFQF